MEGRKEATAKRARRPQESNRWNWDGMEGWQPGLECASKRRGVPTALAMATLTGKTKLPMEMVAEILAFYDGWLTADEWLTFIL